MNNTQIFAFFILPLIVALVAIISTWVFGKLNNPKKEEARPEQSPTRSLYGYDLEKWNYLGMTELTIGLGEQTIGYVFFFSDKKDPYVRDYHFPNSLFRDHQWLHGMADPWKAGEYEYYTPINKSPSKYLKNYMKKEYSVEWCNVKNWWVPIVKEDPGTYWGA